MSIEKRPHRGNRVMVQLTEDDRAWVREQAVATYRSESAVVAELVSAARQGRAPMIVKPKGGLS